MWGVSDKRSEYGDNAYGLVAGSMIELVESNMHGCVQEELAVLKECHPDMQALKKYFNRNPGAYYRAFNDTVATEQKMRNGDPGIRNLTINMKSINGLGLRDRQNLLKEMTEEVVELGRKMGYCGRGGDVEGDVLPASKGVNRIESGDGGG